ncbi:MAG TPA: DNA-3-methyladenine glycosylase 2 family protein [Caulobacteraceae bacterium]|jgi:DNA-3-methyladenine glycosylase II
MNPPRWPDPQTIAAARRALASRDADLALVDAATPAFDWRVRPGGFAGLVNIVMGQQVSTASADAIWARLEAGLGGVTAERVLRASEEELRGLALSQQKARYVREIALAETSGAVDFERLQTLPDEEAIAALTAIKGVGRWTAEIYLMFTEGRVDLFPAADLALQEALRAARGDASRPSERWLRTRAESWAPWRGVAAHLLWRYYAALRQGEATPPAAAVPAPDAPRPAGGSTATPPPKRRPRRRPGGG